MLNNLQITTIPSTFLPSKFNKPQTFVFRNGMRTERDWEKEKLKCLRADSLLGKNPFKFSNAPVLTFKAYFCEPLGEGNKATTRYRKCNIIYYLGDDEMKIYEPQQINSGLNQGILVGKGKMYKPGGGYYTVDDLNIGKTLVLFGREYKLIDCDGFTKEFLTEMGYKVQSPEPEVKDSITEDRNENNVPKSYRQSYVREFKYKPFFEHHPRRLCFFGYYGDGKQLFEEKKDITLYYDLASGTIQLVERCAKWVDGKNSTRVLLRPTRIPKVFKPSTSIGEICSPSILNHIHDVKNILIGGKYYKIQEPTSVLVDSNPPDGRMKVDDHYTDQDLDLGITLNVFGSDVFLYDCDDFTKNYYRATYNKELVSMPRPEVKPFQTHKLVCSHEMFGEPEQTIRTNDPFTPIRYMSDLKKFFKKDKGGYGTGELKFLARMITEDPIESLRIFVIRWFLEDDTIDIKALEQDSRNTSILEHKYLNRMKIIKPQSSIGNFERCYYQPKDMYVGSVIYIRGRTFYLSDADEYTYDYMEKNCHYFLHSNVKRIMKMLQQWAKDNCESLKTNLEKNDPGKTGFIKYEQFKEAMYGEMCKEMRDDYPEQAINTLARHYADNKYVGLRLDDLASKIRTELYRMKYYDFDDIKLALEIHDEDKTGYLPAERLYFAMRSFSIPINRDLLKSFIFKFPSTDNKIKYLDLLESIDWLRNHTSYEKPYPSAININWKHIEDEKDLGKIKYNCFLRDMVM